ncbi:hypothetical protein AHF37_08232 [Paragonimus kellicotti]|nr:hypothetical protein AHF37_08232 [Paragonimus kellicotti]
MTIIQANQSQGVHFCRISVISYRRLILYSLRSGGRVALILDNHMVSGEFLHRSRNFRGKNHIYLGGAFLSVTGLPWEYQQNVTACIADLFVSEQEVSLLDSWDEIRGPIRQCS